MSKPVYEHDCNECIYLGTEVVPYRQGNHTFDVYVCPQMGLPTVVFRFSDIPQDYTSVNFAIIENVKETGILTYEIASRYFEQAKQALGESESYV